MRLVADASVAVKWVLHFLPEEADSEKALSILAAVRSGEIALLQPPHWQAEIVAVIARLRPAFAEETIELLDVMRFQVSETAALYKRAANLSAMLEHHLFDTLYHALALERDSIYVTADERYFAKARKLGHISLLRNFELS